VLFLVCVCVCSLVAGCAGAQLISWHGIVPSLIFGFGSSLISFLAGGI
jgi:hypothetical protein